MNNTQRSILFYHIYCIDTTVNSLLHPPPPKKEIEKKYNLYINLFCSHRNRRYMAWFCSMVLIKMFIITNKYIYTSCGVGIYAWRRSSLTFRLSQIIMCYTSSNLKSIINFGVPVSSQSYCTSLCLFVYTKHLNSELRYNKELLVSTTVAWSSI